MLETAIKQGCNVIDRGSQPRTVVCRDTSLSWLKVLDVVGVHVTLEWYGVVIKRTSSVGT